MEHKINRIVPNDKNNWSISKEYHEDNEKSNISTPLNYNIAKTRNLSNFKIALTNESSPSLNSHIDTQITQRKNNTLTINPANTFGNINEEIEDEISQWNKNFKCQQLKNQIILNEQKMYYGDKKIFKVNYKYPLGSFNRHQTPMNQYKPCYQYDKDNLYSNHKKPIKYIFKSKNVNSIDNNPIYINTDNNRNNTINEHYKLKKTIKAKRLSNFNNIFTSPLILKKVNKIQYDAYINNRALSNDITISKKVSPIKTIDDKFKPILETYDKKEKEHRKPKLFTNLTKKKHRRIFSWDNPETIILENAEKVKKYLDHKSNKFVDQISRQMLFEDNLFNRNIGLYSEFESKCQILKLNKDFKKVANDTLQLKKMLKLDKATMGKKTGDFEKMKRVLKTLNGKWSDLKSIEQEHHKAKVMRTTININN